MYSREKVELFLLATEDGMGPTAAAKFAGVTVGAAKKWATGHLPHSYTGARCRIGARKPRRKEASLGPDKSIYAPPATGPLAGLNEDQIENLLLRAVLADLKAEGWDPASISNRSKCELGERLRRATALPLRSITGFLRISKSSYEYWRPRVAAPRDLGAERTRDLIERRIGRPLGNNVVAGLDYSHDGVEIGARTAIGLQNVIGIDLATIRHGNFGLKLRRTLDPAVVHLLAIQALVERGAVLFVERAKLAHAKRRNRRLGDIPRSALLPNVEPLLNADCLDIHDQAPYKSSHPIVLTFLIQEWGGANTRTAPMGDI